MIKQGQIERADSYFNKAKSLATTPTLQAQTKLIQANTLSRTARIKVAEPQLGQKAVEQYKAALPQLQGQSRVLGYNNYGSLLLRQNKPEEALTALLAVKADYTNKTDPKQQSRYLYNLARAYEKNSDLDAAALSYLGAAVTDTSFTPASRAVMRTLPKIKLTPDVIKSTEEWLNGLIDQGRVELVAQGLETLFNDNDWASVPGAEILFVPLMRYFTVLRMSIDEFSQNWQKRLALPSSALPPAREAAREMTAVFSGKFPITFRSSKTRQSVQVLNDIATRSKYENVITRFVQVVGASFKADGHYEMALRRYALAVNIDRTNTAAALHAATILLEHPDVIPEADSLTQQLIGTLFRGKGEAYLGEDWDNILRFHTVLGTIYKEQGEWGNSYEPYGAIFQFEHAIQAAQRLQESNPEQVERIAGIKLALAEVYLKCRSEERGHIPICGCGTHRDVGKGPRSWQEMLLWS